MDQRKAGIIVYILLMILILAASVCRAEHVFRQWESITSFKQTKMMVLYEGDVWVATTGGLLRIDPATMTHQAYTNVVWLR